MKSVKNTASLAIAVLVGALLFGGGVAVSQGTFAPARVGFVDVADIFKRYTRANEIQQQVRADMQRVDKALQQRFEELKRRRADLDLLVPGTPEHIEKKRQIDFEAFKLEYEEKEQKRAILDSAVKRMNNVYTEIRREAENYARRNGLHCVLMSNEQEIQARSLEELQVLIASRPVIFRDKAMDITQPVLKVLEGK
jgi:Skp family chaperone for outer membrane proteins